MGASHDGVLIYELGDTPARFTCLSLSWPVVSLTRNYVSDLFAFDLRLMFTYLFVPYMKYSQRDTGNKLKSQNRIRFVRKKGKYRSKC